MQHKDIIRTAIPAEQIQAFEVKVSPLIRGLKSDMFQRLLLLILIIGCWEIAATIIQQSHNGHLKLPKASDTFRTLYYSINPKDFTETIKNFTIASMYEDGKITFEKFWETFPIPIFFKQILMTIFILILCTVIGVLLGFIFAGICISTRIGHNFLELIAPPMSSLPAVALISAASLAFQSNLSAMIFVVSNAVFWTVLSSTHAGFSHVPETLRRVGQNYGLSPFTFVQKILFPAALPSIITGIRLGISRAFQALVAVELVVGSAYGSGALGFFLQDAKGQAEPPLIYSGLITVMLISYILDSRLFAWIENKTIKKWGMKTA